MKKIINIFNSFVVVFVLVFYPLAVLADEEVLVENQTITEEIPEIETPEEPEEVVEEIVVEESVVEEEPQELVEEVLLEDNSTTTEEMVVEESVQLLALPEEDLLNLDEEGGVRIIIRKDASVIFDDIVSIPESETVEVISNDSVSRIIDSNSVLALVSKADEETDLFRLSDLQYYSSFDSFLINCIEVSISDVISDECYNWQYVVNDVYPYVGVNVQTVNVGDTIYLYFGQSKQIIVPSQSTTTNTIFFVEANSYNYLDNTWIPIANTVVGATQTNPDDPWTPLEIATSTTNSLGLAQFSLTATGTYYFGFKDDYYYPTWNFDIIDATTTATSTNSGTENGNNGGGGNSHNKPDLEDLLGFLDNKQHANGSFGADLYTDWAAVAYGASSGHNDAKNKLKEYLKSDNLDGDSVTDYERRAMAMLSLGLNPYKDGKEDYISRIVNSFDGTQIGEADLYNDDIFGILVLLNSGFKEEEDIIKKSAEFIASKQQGSGAFESIDITGAGVQALALVTGYEENISRAINYLKSVQVNDGGFYNSFSTSWAIQGFVAGGESIGSVEKNNKNPFDYLWSKQQSDGGMEEVSDSDDNRIWSTSYAVPAVTEKTWDQILRNVSKSAIAFNEELGGDNSGEVLGVSTTTPVSVFSTSTTTLIQEIMPDDFYDVAYTAKPEKENNLFEENASSTEVLAEKTELLANAGSIKFDWAKIMIVFGIILAGFGAMRIMGLWKKV